MIAIDGVGPYRRNKYKKSEAQVRRNLITANWKMNGTFAMAHSLVDEIAAGTHAFESVDIVICPPHVYLPFVARQITGHPGMALGAQNCSEHSSGAYTGEVSSTMLKEVGCEYIICGHSERREYHRESDDIVARKAIIVLEQQLLPIVCVGETLDERQSGTTQAVIERQIDAILQQCENRQIEQLTIAYEPVWAIGTGRSATPEQAQEVHQIIRRQVAKLSQSAAEQCRILYGGSVTGENAASVLSQPDVDGCLVGGASLKSSQFIEICKAAQR